MTTTAKRIGLGAFAASVLGGGLYATRGLWMPGGSVVDVDEGPADGLPAAVPEEPSLIKTGVMAADDVAMLIKLERESGIHGIALFLAAVGATESNWKSEQRYSAHNTRASEVAASARALAGGMKRGYPQPKYFKEAAAFGSGGLYGLLCPYALWSGKRDKVVLDWKPEDALFDPVVASCLAADFVYRYYLNGIRTWLQCRVAWKSLKYALNEPDSDGEKTKQVVANMVEKTLAQGLDAVLPNPLDVSRYPGLRELMRRMGVQL